MQLFEVSVKYNKKLNPKIWNGSRLKPEVLNKLREIADAFLKFLDVPNLKVDDMVLIGSSANFNWTDSSDLDLHLVMDLGSVMKVCKDFTEELFDAKNDTWKERHDISIYGLPVEVYIQDNTTNKEKEEGIERHITGVFSVKDNKWIRKPSYEPPEVNDTDVKVKANSFKRKINKIVDGDLGMKYAKGLHGKIKRLRKSGLHKFGEFSTENLVFKELRNSGAMEKLLDYVRKATSDKLSLEESEWENTVAKTQKAARQHLYRVQAARLHELEILYNRVKMKYPDWLAVAPDHSTDMNVRSNHFVSPDIFRRNVDRANVLPKDVIDLLVKRHLAMLQAKKYFEDAGGQYPKGKPT